jgi:C-terminal processing protease CtpA/Prc
MTFVSQTTSRRTLLAGGGAALGAALLGPTPARAAAGAGDAGGLDGMWDTDGYGTTLSIDGDRARIFETTLISRIEAAPAARVAADRFVGPEGGFTVRRGLVPDRAVFHAEGSVGDRYLRRRAALPTVPPLPSGPLAVFDVFWQTYAEQYPFFAAKGIDWRAVRRRYRREVDSAGLFDLLVEMIEPLGDAHTGLRGGTRAFGGHRPGTEIPTLELEQRVRPFIERRDLGHSLDLYAQGWIGYADLPGRLGYLRPIRFLFAEGTDFAAHQAELDRALDAILTPARTTGPTALRGLVIDLRVNGGGSDALALRLASRLTAHPHFAYAKRARNDPHDATRFTSPQPLCVPGTDAPRYTGPIAILVGGSTMSAGETFTQAMLNRSPRPVLIGEHTQGVFSDALLRTLPNGWQFILPNEQFLDRTGHAYDGTGLPPDIHTPVFTAEELAADRDSAFDRAVALLR